MFPEQFQNYRSYSRYGRPEPTYPLSDEHFAEIIDGNLICTDKEITIECDGNVCLVTPKGDVLHIGTIPFPEVGKVDTFFDGNGMLHIKYLVYCDCDHHHGEWIEETIDTKLTVSRFIKMKAGELCRTLNKTVFGWNGGSLRNRISFCIAERNGRIVIKACGSYKNLRQPWLSYEAVQDIALIPETGFVLLPEKDGRNRIIEVLGFEQKLTGPLQEFNKNFLKDYAEYKRSRKNY